MEEDRLGANIKNIVQKEYVQKSNETRGIPLQCLVHGVTSTVGSAMDSVTNSITSRVDTVADSVTGGIGGVVDTVRDRVEDTVGTGLGVVSGIGVCGSIVGGVGG